jgi:hypothetical protein
LTLTVVSRIPSHAAFVEKSWVGSADPVVQAAPWGEKKEHRPMPVLEVNNLVVDFETDEGVVEAIDHFTLTVQEGKSSASWERAAVARRPWPDVS